MTGALLIALAAVAALVWVAAPLRRAAGITADVRGARDEAESRKRAALTALLDLEDDFRVGKLSEEDFAALRADHEADVLVALRELDLLDASEADPLEADIAAARERLACPACGAWRRPGEKCPRCGA